MAPHQGGGNALWKTMMLNEGCAARLDQLLFWDVAPPEPDPSAGWHKEQQSQPPATTHPPSFYPNLEPPIMSSSLLLLSWHEIGLLSPGGTKPYRVCLVTIDVRSRQKAPALLPGIFAPNSPSPGVPVISHHFLFSREIYYHLNSIPA